MSPLTMTRRTVNASGLDDEHLRAGRGQFSRQDRTGRPRSDDDEVIVSSERSRPVTIRGGTKGVIHC
jgi:hypothetical protein